MSDYKCFSYFIIIFNNTIFIDFSINLPLLEYIREKNRMSDYYSAHLLPYFSSDSLATTNEQHY